MNWPLRWLNPVEWAHQTHETLIQVNRAMRTMRGEALANWQRDHERMVKRALEIERMCNEQDD